MIYKTSIFIPKKEAVDARRICEEPPTRSEVGRDDPVYIWSAYFSNKYGVDVRVVASSEPDEDPCWCEAVLFAPAPNGNHVVEVACSEPSDLPFGDWELRCGDDVYVVSVNT
jgi:hypothetical protein